uniref:Uncharacterized protein n=1 Tax=Trichuris muris TaxID=70415 RepID=A0A5S6QJ01_TRIMR
MSRYNSNAASHYDIDWNVRPSYSYLTRPRSSTYLALNPFYPITHAIPDYPCRRYDLYAPALWSYPIWKYLYDPGERSYYYRRYYDNYRRLPYYPSQFYYASYLAGEMDYYSLDLNRAIDNYRFWRKSYQTAYPSYRYYYYDHALNLIIVRATDCSQVVEEGNKAGN